MKERIEQLRQEFFEEVKNCLSLDELNNVKVKYLGKSGQFTALLKGLKDLSPEDKPVFGALLNKAKVEMETVLENAKAELQSKSISDKLANESIDITISKNEQRVGTLHPIQLMQNQIIEIFEGLGFSVKEGPEAETDYFNFQALNIPSDHPARDMQDTFFLGKEILLRTHTSPNQARVMSAEKPPLKIVCPGKVYRPDSDASHSPMFHQIEGLVVDKHLTLCDLKGTLETVAKKLFGGETKVRFRPSYFPFTEPSVEVDLTCSACGGKGCSLCKGTGWIEVLGAGMVHPFVLENCGIGSKEYNGYAFGFGLERFAMIKYGIPDIRLFFENDVNFLKQFDKTED